MKTGGSGFILGLITYYQGVNGIEGRNVKELGK
jgi:hypothetical protein